MLSPGNDIEMHGNDTVIVFIISTSILKRRRYGWWCVVKIRYWRIEPPFFLPNAKLFVPTLGTKALEGFFLPVNLANDSEVASVIQKESCASWLVTMLLWRASLNFCWFALFCTCFFLFTARSCFSGGKNSWETGFKNKFLFKTLWSLTSLWQLGFWK